MRLALICFMALGLTGCSVLGINPRPNLTPEQQASAIKSTARTGTFIALTELSDDDAELAEKALEIKTPIEEDVLPLLHNGSVTFDSVTIGLLEEKIDRRYVVYLQQAITLLELYYEVPDVGEIMPPEDVALWIALFEGIVQGADDALLTLEE